MCKRCDVLEAALREFMDITLPASTLPMVDPDFGRDVEALGERIGYGALMSSAQASWRAMLSREGWPVGGEHTAGPCYSVLMGVRKQAEKALRFK